jgi:hypothetical protein
MYRRLHHRTVLPGKSLSEAAMGWLFSSTALSGYVDVSTSNRQDWSA